LLVVPINIMLVMPTVIPGDPLPGAAMPEHPAPAPAVYDTVELSRLVLCRISI
jgi:hypothetical protein